MNWFKPTVLSQKQMERLKKLQAKGRKHYIFYRGVLGWGLPVFLLKTSWRWYHVYGWHVPTRGDMFESFLIGLPIWLVGGYLFGALMWKNHEDRQLRGNGAQA